jgi:hypothetical protein
LQFDDLLFELFYLFVDDSDGLFVFLVVFEHASQFLFFDHYLVEDGGVVHEVPALQLSVSAQISVVLSHLFDTCIQL